MQATWTKSGKGQVGLVEQRAAMTLSGKGRQRFIEGLCTTSGDAEILEAAIPNISDPAQDYSLICDIEMTGVALLDESIGRFHFDASGPWLGRVPYLAPGKRHWPVVFDYPQVQVTRLVIRAPDGFGSGDAPPPRQFESPYGKYSLTLTPTEDGYLMERAFALVPLVVPALEYDALQKFLQDVTEADHAVIVFERVGTQ